MYCSLEGVFSSLQVTVASTFGATGRGVSRCTKREVNRPMDFLYPFSLIMCSAISLYQFLRLLFFNEQVFSDLPPVHELWTFFALHYLSGFLSLYSSSFVLLHEVIVTLNPYLPSTPAHHHYFLVSAKRDESGAVVWPPKSLPNL